MLGTLGKSSLAVLALCAAPIASAQRVGATKTASVEEGTQSFGARAGVVSASDVTGIAAAYGAYGDYAVSDNVLGGASLDYWRVTSGVRGEKQISEVDDLTFGVHAKLVAGGVGSTVQPYGLAGLAAHRMSLKRKTEVTEGTSLERYQNSKIDVETKLGLDLAAGALVRVQENVDAGAELRWRRLFDNTTIADNQLAVTGTLAYRM